MSRAGLSTLYDPNWSILGQLLAHILCYVTPSTNVTVTDTLPVAIDGTDLNETVTVTAGQSVVFIIPATIKQNAGYSTTIINTAYYSHASDSSGDTVTFTTLADITPPAFITTPVLITPTGGITLSNQQPTFDWENAVDIL